MLYLISALQLSVAYTWASVCRGGQTREVGGFYCVLVTVNRCRATVWAEWGQIWGYMLTHPELSRQSDGKKNYLIQRLLTAVLITEQSFQVIFRLTQGSDMKRWSPAVSSPICSFWFVLPLWTLNVSSDQNHNCAFGWWCNIWTIEGFHPASAG